MRRGGGGEEVRVAPVAQDLERILPDGRGTAPDENRGACLWGRDAGNWPGEGEGEIGCYGICRVSDLYSVQKGDREGS